MAGDLTGWIHDNESNLYGLSTLALTGARIGTGLAAGASAQEAQQRFAEILQIAGRQEADELRRAFAQRAGEIRASYAGHGVEVDRGTPLDQLAVNAFRGEQAVQKLLYNFRLRAERAKIAGSYAMSEANAGAFATGLSGLRTLLDLPTRTPAAPDPLGEKP